MIRITLEMIGLHDVITPGQGAKKELLGIVKFWDNTFDTPQDECCKVSVTESGLSFTPHGDKKVLPHYLGDKRLYRTAVHLAYACFHARTSDHVYAWEDQTPKVDIVQTVEQVEEFLTSWGLHFDTEYGDSSSISYDYIYPRMCVDAQRCGGDKLRKFVSSITDTTDGETYLCVSSFSELRDVWNEET